MTSTSEEQGQDWDDTAEEAHEAPTASSRRQLLGRAAGGLVLAASGLFLPDWLMETEAREGALGGAKGGRRGKDHRGRHRKRTHGDKKDQDHPRGAAVEEDDVHLRWITFHLYNDRPVASPNPSVKVTPWVQAANGGGWGHFPNSTIPNGEMKSFRMRSANYAVMIIDDRYYVSGLNQLFAALRVQLAYGGKMDASGYFGAKQTVTRFLSENEGFERVMDGRRFTIKRIPDSKHYIEFDVHFT